MLYAGLDVHKTYCFGTILDEGGRKIKEGRFPNTAEGLEFTSSIRRYICWRNAHRDDPRLRALEKRNKVG